MKKGFCGVLFAALLLNTTVFGLTVDNDAELPTLIFGSRPFMDVTQNDWYYDGVMFAYNNGILHGTADEIFSPDESLTRAMMITALYRNAGSPESGAAAFDDVEKGSWYEKAVAWGSENGIVSGTGLGKFSPEESITREQLSVMLANYARQSGKALNGAAELSAFADAAEVSDWAKDAVAAMVGAGVLGGNESGMLCASNNATRAETAVMLSRFFK